MNIKELTYRLKRRLKLIMPYKAPQKWIFIVGCNNSGTSLIHDMVSRLSHVSSLPKEGQFCTTRFTKAHTVGYGRVWSLNYEFFRNELNSVDSVKLKNDWASYMKSRERKYWLEKSPTNTMRISWLNNHFENAIFIGVVRNGYAVVEGIQRKAQQPRSMLEYAKHWRLANEILLEQLDNVENKILVKYEDVVVSPQSFLDEVCSLLEIQNNKIDLGTIQIHDYPSGLKDFNEEAINRLSEEEKIIFINEAEAMMQRLGYCKFD